MKLKLISILTLCFFSSTCFAQNSSAILRGGLNLANVTVSPDGRIDDANMLASFQVGIIGDLNVSSLVAIQPGLLVTGKGSKTQDGDPSDATYFKATSNPVYIELPVNIVFKAPLAGSAKFFAGAGPYLAIGIAGKNKTEGKTLGVGFSGDEDIRWSNDDPSTLDYEEGAGFGIMKRFDYGLNGTAGVEGKTVVLSINYGLGLAKLQSGANSSANANNKHRVFSFTMGFRL